jgi:hypothetical protein
MNENVSAKRQEILIHSIQASNTPEELQSSIRLFLEFAKEAGVVDVTVPAAGQPPDTDRMSTECLPDAHRGESQPPTCAKPSCGPKASGEGTGLRSGGDRKIGAA